MLAEKTLYFGSTDEIAHQIKELNSQSQQNKLKLHNLFKEQDTYA